MGNFIFVRNFGAISNPVIKSVTCDKFSNVYLTGHHSGTSDFDPGLGDYLLSAYGSMAIFVEKLNSNGDFIWAESFSGGSNSYGGDITTDSSDNIYVCGIFSDTVDFDPSIGVFNLVSEGIFSGFILKLDTSGNLIWVVKNDGIGMEYCNSMSVDNDGSITTLGSFSNTVDLDPGVGVVGYIADGSMDGYIQRLSQDSCSSFTLILDSLSRSSCIAPAFGYSFALNGTTPYNFNWNTSPPINDSVGIFSDPGIYTLTVNDADGCLRQCMLIVEGPSFIDSVNLCVNMLHTAFRPGLSSYIWLNAGNQGCDTISGSLTLILDPLVNYDSSLIPPDYISGDTLIWNFSSINYDSIRITPQIFLTTTTTAVTGDTVCFQVLINPVAGDADPTNNYKTICAQVVNSYDPNDKQVYPQGECVPKYVLKDEKLTYTIRFQNTGTADAINIYLLDTLDPNLDLNSVRVIGNSHYVITEVLPGNVLKFRFDNIYLPDSASDEPNSHGYVIYEVDPLPAVPNNTVINNTAHIFFDFNPAIVTNTISNTIIDTLPNYSATQNINLVCGSNYVFPDGTTQNDITANVTHISYFSPVISCDSIITTNITIDPINLTVNQSVFTLTTVATATSYQWIDCNNSNLPISGETNQSFTATSDGDYAVVITNGSCSDTSACYNITGTGISNLNDDNNISVYPNPTNNSITISTTNIIANKIELKDVYGRTIKILQPNSSQTILDLQNVESGIYFVQIVNGNSQQTVKIIKQ